MPYTVHLQLQIRGNASHLVSRAIWESLSTVRGLPILRTADWNLHIKYSIIQSGKSAPRASPQLLSKRVKSDFGFNAVYKAGNAHQAAVHHRLTPAEGQVVALQMLLRSTVRLRTDTLVMRLVKRPNLFHPGPKKW